MDIPANEPSELVLGTTLQFTKSLPEFPAGEGWTLAYTITNAANAYSVATTASGDDFAVSVAPATTAGWAAGDYQMTAIASKDGAKFRAATAFISLKPDPTSAGDFRSHAKKVLDSVNAVIAGRATQDQEQLQIANRSLKRTPLADLLALRDKYQALYNAELADTNAANGKARQNKIKYRL